MDGEGTSERLLRLLELLQQRPAWTGPDLALRLDTTARTVRRDVERLRRLGYPVLSAAGVGGGYQLGAGTRLPPLLLDDEEAIATAVALLVGAGAAADGGEAAVRAVSKLDRMLPTRLRDEVAALAASVSSFAPTGTEAVGVEVLLAVARATRDQRRLGFSYAGRSGRTRRDVEPHGLVSSGRRWYLFGFDRDREGWRTFRVDRMRDVSPGDRRFRRRPDAPDPATYVHESVTSAVYSRQARFLVHAPAAAVRARVSAGAARVVPRGRGRCELRAGAEDLDLVLALVAALGHDFEVLEPPDLTERAEVIGRRLLTAARRRSTVPS